MSDTITLRRNSLSARLTALCRRNVYVWATFVISLTLMLVAFGLHNVSPFGEGDKQILVTDLWHQYYPFLADFQYKLQHGESLFWTWSVGGGVNYFSLMSYYLAGPLNFLSLFVPSDFLREFLMFSVAIKIALAGSFMAYFLKSLYKRNDASLVIFGISFSFCAFFMGYYWNTIWLDTACITPLVALGIVKLLTENNFRLYTVTLALSLLSNYYIGFFTCIFVLLIFIGYNIVRWQNLRVFLVNIAKTGVFTLLGIGITAFFLLPAFLALQNTHASGSAFPTDFRINIGSTNDLAGVLSAMKSITGNLVNFTVAANKEVDAMPNIACGSVSIFFAFLSLTSKDIKLREKLVCLGLVIFMLLSCIIRQLDYIWHGFHFTNMISYRFTYLISFVIIVMGFRAFMNIERINLIGAVVASALSYFVLMMELDFTGKVRDDGEWSYDQGVYNMFEKGTHNRDERIGWVAPTLIAVAILFALITVMVILYTKRIIPKQALMISLAIVVIVQSGYTAFFGVDVTTVTTTSGYPSGEESTETIIDYMNELEADTPELWRAEMSSTQTLNDGALNHYHGLSMFNSMANESMTLLFENFGLTGWQSGNRYTYQESSPVTNMFMNLKYIISRNGYVNNTYDLSELNTSGNIKLYKNNHYLPMGFMVNDSILRWEEITAEDSFNPFEKQNEFFRLATGINADVYERVQVTDQGHTDASQFQVTLKSYGEYSFSCLDSNITPHLKWNYVAPESGLYLVWTKIDNGDDITITKNNDQASARNYSMGRPYIACVGYFNKGERLSVNVNLKQGASGNGKVYVNRLDQAVFEQGYDLLKQSVMTTTRFSNGSVMEGTINAKNNGVFYTSIPYEKGWTAYVDGEQVELTPVGGSLVAFRLSAGEHEIKLRYYPNGFWPGFAVTVICLAGFIAACILTYKLKKPIIPEYAKDKSVLEAEEARRE